MYREFNLVHAYTIEVSFMGPNRGVFQNLHFNPKHMQLAGRQFCETLASLHRDEERVKSVHAEIMKLLPQGGASVRQKEDYSDSD